MEPNPFRVSVVIPAYNEGKRIATAIAAIRAQAEPPGEIIVVDDGSTDDTASVAERLQVRVLRQANGGVASARNAGIRASSYDWVAFCDADDRWSPDLLAYARHAASLRPEVGFVFADYRTEIGRRITLPSMFASVPLFARAGRRLAPSVIFFERRTLLAALARQNFISPSTIVVRRALVLDNDAFFTPSLPSGPDFHVAEDIEWYLRILAYTDAVAIDRVMLTYSRHPGSISDNPGRVGYGNVKLGELIAERPERYASGLADAFRAHRRLHVRLAAIDDIRSLHFAHAAARVREAQAIEFRWADLVLVLAAAAGRTPPGRYAFGLGRSLWQTACSPVLRAVRRGLRGRQLVRDGTDARNAPLG